MYLFAIQKRPKKPPRRPRTPPRRPKMPPRRAQDAPRRPQDAPKTPQDAPKTRPRRPKAAPRDAQDGPRRPKTQEKKGFQKRSEAQSPPDLDFGAFRGGFWTVFGMILEGFRVDLGSQMEQDRYTEGHREPPRATESHRDSQRAIGKNSEPQRATESHREPRRATDCHSELLKRTALPVPCQIRFMLGVFLRAKKVKKSMVFLRFLLFFEVYVEVKFKRLPRRGQRRPKRPPRRATTRPRRPQEAFKSA